MKIDPNGISSGDPVVLQDKEKNIARGTASFDEQGQIIITAFKTDIVFARWSAQARAGLGGYSTVSGIKIVGHNPPLDQLAFDVVPRQRFGGSDPT